MKTILVLIITASVVNAMGDFNYCFNKLMSDRYEGTEFSDTSNDYGGKTKFGISEPCARHYGYTGDMRKLEKDTARDIYFKLFWLPMCCDKMPTKIAFEVFEVAVHSGIGHDGNSKAIEILQKSINIFLLSSQIKVDGHIGIATITALNLVLERHGEQKIKMWYNIFQGSFYYEITRNDPTQQAFLAGGWTNRLEFK